MSFPNVPDATIAPVATSPLSAPPIAHVAQTVSGAAGGTPAQTIAGSALGISSTLTLWPLLVG